jgi:hypothetical protein
MTHIYITAIFVQQNGKSHFFVTVISNWFIWSATNQGEIKVNLYAYTAKLSQNWLGRKDLNLKVFFKKS